MLAIVCGEDNVASRDYFNELQSEYRDKGYEIKRITADELINSPDLNSQFQNLFGFKQIFTTENLSKRVGRKKGDKLASMLNKIDQNKEFVLLDWEDSVSSRDLKTGKLGSIKEFRPSTSVFKLLEACSPHNLASFTTILRSILNPKTEVFLYIMLVRHVRTLVLAKSGDDLVRLQSWQKSKLISQANRWEEKKLLSFYQKLLGLDFALKTGKNPFGLAKSIEYISCYYIS